MTIHGTNNVHFRWRQTDRQTIVFSHTHRPCTHARRHARVLTYTPTYTHTYTHPHTATHAADPSTHTHTHTHPNTHTLTSHWNLLRYTTRSDGHFRMPINSQTSPGPDFQSTCRLADTDRQEKKEPHPHTPTHRQTRRETEN